MGQGFTYKERQQTDTLPDGSLLDLDSYDWANYKLTKRQKLFIVWYTTPNQAGFLNPTQAALKAGYKKNSAYNARNDLLKYEPKVREVIQKFTEDNLKTTVSDAVKKIITEKIKRATYNVGDFYESKTIEIEGKEGTRQVFIPAAAKSLEEIPEENKKLIDNVEVNNNGIVIYKLPNREREAHELLEIDAKINEEKLTGDYDVETTVDLIKENLATVKTTVRMNNQKIRESAGNYIESSENQPDYD